jgi:hypothetical protein
MEKEIVVFTGKRGMYDFETSLMIEGVESNPIRSKSLEELFRKERNKSYALQQELDKIQFSKWYKVLKFFRLI